MSDAGGGQATTIAPLDHNITCNGNPMQAWHASVAFGLWYTGYDAEDYIYGTSNQDTLYSDESTGTWYDNVTDLICGYGGDDEIYGDFDTSTYAYPTCLDGGAGNSDVCADGDVTSDCESTSGSTVATSSCSCGSAPPTIWIW
jgi:hypothetical protein